MIQLDKELKQLLVVIQQLAVKKMEVKPSTLYIYMQSQNRLTKRIGGVIKRKARVIRISANHLALLWPEAIRSAVYLYNGTLYHFTRQITLYKICRQYKPELTHLRVYSYKAFNEIRDTQINRNRLKRLDPKAQIGFLIGY